MRSRVIVVDYAFSCQCILLQILCTSVPDPDPYVFGPPGSESVSERYGSADPEHCFAPCTRTVPYTIKHSLNIFVFY
jgi:hypothetical protein